MPRYHISPRSGDIMPCGAKMECPFAAMGAPHFDSREEAESEYAEMRARKEMEEFRIGNLTVDYLPAGQKRDAQSFLVQKGIYVLADPERILWDDPQAWNKWRAVSFQSGDRAGGATINGYPVLGLNVGEPIITVDSSGRNVGTESGYMALFPLEFAEKMEWTMDQLNGEGPLMNFDQTSVFGWQNGKVLVGDMLTVTIEPETYELSDEEHDEIFYELDEKYPSMRDQSEYPEKMRDKTSLDLKERERRARVRQIFDRNMGY